MRRCLRLVLCWSDTATLRRRRFGTNWKCCAPAEKALNPERTCGNSHLVRDSNAIPPFSKNYNTRFRRQRFTIHHIACISIAILSIALCSSYCSFMNSQFFQVAQRSGCCCDGGGGGKKMGFWFKSKERRSKTTEKKKRPSQV